MATLKDKMVRMQNSRKFEYRFKNNYRIIAKKHDDGWHVTYYDSDWNGCIGRSRRNCDDHHRQHYSDRYFWKYYRRGLV